VLADKDWRGVIRELAPVTDGFILTKAPSAPRERSWNPAEAQAFALAEGHEAELEPDIDAALERAAKRAGTILVTGSFHTVGDAMLRLQVSPFAA
jgi:dihydrofolate synthase/folylpolyglutamate synthase